MSVQILQGHVIKTLKSIESGSVRCAVTSPPYYGLRSYLKPDDPLKKYEIGTEETPELYIEKLIHVFRGVWDALADDGTLWLNLGDSYWGGKGSNANLDTHLDDRIAEGRTLQRPQTRIEGVRVIPTNGKHDVYKPKDLCMIPARVAIALQQDGWYLRSEIVWHKPNPMPESVKDRPTRSHEMIYLLSKSEKYYYDAAAIAEPSAWADKDSRADGNGKYISKEKSASGNYKIDGVSYGKPNEEGFFTRNKRDVWTVTTKPYSGAHFATFPPDLIEPCILAGSAKGDIVLDPFGGSGTTAAVALKNHRRAILCELNNDYIPLIDKRLSEVQPILFVT